MALLINEIPKKLKKQSKRETIAKAVNYEKRLRFHTETFLEPAQASTPVTVFLDWVKTLIPKDKYQIFVQLFKFPTSLVELTGRIYHELEKVFDGRNSAVNFLFKDSDLRADWDLYRADVLNEPRVWREDGWDTLKTAVNSMVVVDLPSEQTSERPEPYFYFLPIENVLDYCYLPNGAFEYVIFKASDKRIAVYDDENYRVFEVDKKGEIIGDAIVDEQHDLGYCPIAWFWQTPIAKKIPDIKKNPITSQLSNYDWALFFSISKKHLDLYAPYPIYSAYESDCDFMNNETGEYCDGGFLRDADHNYLVQRDGTVRSCPVCAEKKIVGVGSFVEVPVPKNDAPDLKDPISITTIDKDSLEFNVNEVARLKEEIYISCVGTGGEIQKEAINEKQVYANFENRQAVLNNLKVNFEKIMMFTNDTCCRLRYGSDYLGSSVNLGTEFYIFSVDDLYNQFEVAKKNGATESQLDSIAEQIIQTEFRNDPMQLQRMMLLKELEPYRNYTRDEVLNLKRENLIDEELLRVKINFNSFVERFERENINIMEFGSLLPLDKKVSIITEKLKEYGRESISSGAKED